MRATLLILLFSLFATVHLHAQTNDPLVNQQYYIGAHNIDQLWNTTTGSSSTRIAIHSATGFTSSHEDMAGSRYLNPYSNWFSPEKGFASELAGIVGANTNNSTGMAGINWNATLKSYNFVESNVSSADPDYEFTSNNIDYHVSIDNMSTMLDAANNDNMDVHLFSFGVPTSNIGKISNFSQNPDPLNLYRLLYEGPNFPMMPPKQEDQFIDDFYTALQTIGSNIWNAINNPVYSIGSPYRTFRSKLWDSAENQNRILVAPVGDVAGGKLPAPILMPFSFDDYVVGVGGGELDAFGDPIHWNGAGESSYINVTAAAKDLVTISSEGYDSYNTSFSSTTGSAAIVAGVASLLKEEVNNYSYEDIRYILQNSAIDIEDPGKDNKTGDGWLDAQAALSYIQNNDFVRYSAPKSEIITISDTQDNSTAFKLDKEIAYEFCPSVAPSIVSGPNPDGWINTFVGRVEFENGFSSTPDVWLRNSSSGTDVNPTPFLSGLFQHYEPFEKSLTITSVDQYGFEFEMKYWEISAYNIMNRLVCSGDLPNIGSIHIDYTAVGDELPPPPAPPTVNLSGPTNMFQGSTGTFTANVTGGVPPYSYQWSYKPEFGTNWLATGTNSSTYVHTAGQPNGEHVRVVVQDSYPNSDDDSKFFTIIGSSFPLTTTDPLPESFAIEGNYPNPFNPSSTISYALPERADVTLSIYNMLGQRVATLVDGEIQPGRHDAVFDASALSSGNYIARFTAVGISGETFEESMNMQLIK